MKNVLRVAGAFFAAAIVASASAIVGNAVRYGHFSFTNFHVVLLFALIFGVALGLPSFFLFRCFGWIRLWQYAIGGAAIGLAATFLFFGIPFEFQPSVAYLWSLTIQYWEFPFGGAFGATVFWLIAVRTARLPAT